MSVWEDFSRPKSQTKWGRGELKATRKSPLRLRYELTKRKKESFADSEMRWAVQLITPFCDGKSSKLKRKLFFLPRDSLSNYFVNNFEQIEWSVMEIGKLSLSPLHDASSKSAFELLTFPLPLWSAWTAVDKACSSSQTTNSHELVFPLSAMEETGIFSSRSTHDLIDLKNSFAIHSSQRGCSLRIDDIPTRTVDISCLDGARRKNCWHSPFGFLISSLDFHVWISNESKGGLEKNVAEGSRRGGEAEKFA